MSNAKMKAAFCTNYGEPEVLKIVLTDKPIPREDEVLIRIHASAVNSADVRVRGLDVEGFMKIVMRFVLGFTKPRKPILGTTFAGVISEIGKNVTKFKKGDEVFGMTGFKFGTHAEYIALKETDVIVNKPKNASFEEASAIIFGGSTAYHFLMKADIEKKSKMKILIYGATGAVGTSAVQIAKYFNSDVTAVCSDEGKELVTSLSADDVIIYSKEDFTKNGKRYDLIFDAIGKLNRKMVKSSLTERGIFSTVGGFEVASETTTQLLFLKDLFDKNKLKAVIDKIYSLDDIIEAHRYVDTKRKKGNVVIKVV
ncbi:MAG: NAD(P)-dependent alcohol dehydrogenase [Ignavibacteriaceae bacterium]|nr:NAD(P)-dependent alcohol dehydrogenase [Ignavibacteriaceae bacterium]